VGLNEATIKKYIEEQEKHDIAVDKLSVKEYEDPVVDPFNWTQKRGLKGSVPSRF